MNPPENLAALAQRLVQHRRSAGLSQSAVVAQMRERGHLNWSQPTLSSLENGARRLEVLEASTLANIYGLPTVDALLRDADPFAEFDDTADVSAYVEELERRMPAEMRELALEARRSTTKMAEVMAQALEPQAEAPAPQVPAAAAPTDLDYVRERALARRAAAGRS